MWANGAITSYGYLTISMKYSQLAKHAGRVQRLLSVNVQYAMNMHMTSRRRQ